MKPFLALLKVSSLGMLYATSQMGRKKNTRLSGLGILFFLGGIMLVISIGYSVSLALAFRMLGGMDIMLKNSIALAFIFPILIVFLAAQSMIFGTKDVDILFSLPVSAFSIMMSRISALYLESLFMSALLLLPASISYALFGGSVGWQFFPMIILLCIFGAFVPVLVSLLFAFFLSFIVARLPHKNLFIILLSVLFLVGTLLFGFTMSSTMQGATPTDIAGIRQAVDAISPLLWAYNMTQGSLVALGQILCISLLPFLLCVWLFSRSYKNILTKLASHKLRTDFKLGQKKARSPLGALLGKEARKFFGTPIYFMNSGVGSLLMILFAGGAALNRGKIQAFFQNDLAQQLQVDMQVFLLPVLLFSLCFMCGISFISSVSISLEGRNLWVLKSAPLSTAQIFTAKAGFNILVNGVTALLTIPLIGWAFSLDVLLTLLLLLQVVLFASLTALTGLLVNLRFPRLDAENETIVVKQSASVLVSMGLYFGYLLLSIGLYVVLNFLSFSLFSLVYSLLLCLAIGLFLYLLRTKGQKLFTAL